VRWRTGGHAAAEHDVLRDSDGGAIAARADRGCVRSGAHARRLDLSDTRGAAHLAALLLEIERAHGRPPQFARLRDGAAPIIGSSQAIRLVRHRIEQAAAVDYTVLIEGSDRSTAAPQFY
jgi:hypothetical protein